MQVWYINAPYNSSLEKEMGKLVCYLLKCKKKIEVQKQQGIVGKGRIFLHKNAYGDRKLKELYSTV